MIPVLGIRDILVWIRMRIHISDYRIRMQIREAQKHTDPEHWYIYIILQRYKVIKKLQNSRNQGFSCYFCLLMEGSGAGSVLLTNGSVCESGSPKNMVHRYYKYHNPPMEMNCWLCAGEARFCSDCGGAWLAHHGMCDPRAAVRGPCRPGAARPSSR